MQIWCKSSAWQVCKNTRPDRGDAAVMTLQAAKGGHAFGQILLRHTEAATLQAVTLSPLPAGVTVRCLLQGYEVFNDGTPYPDRLLEFAPCPLAANATQGAWLAVAVASDAPDGSAGFYVTLHTDAGDYPVPVRLAISAVCLPAPSAGRFDHTYFWNADATRRYGKDYALYSEPWWQLLKAYAQAMKALRVNTLHIDIFPFLAGDGTRRVGPKSWSFDFSRLDSVLEHMLQWGDFRRIAVGAPLSSLTGETVTGFDTVGKPVTYRTDSSDGHGFVVSLLRALRRYFEKSGRLSMLMLHICDEPHETARWLWLRQQAQKLLPGVPCAEPLDEYHSAQELREACDEFIPRLDVFEQGRDFFGERARAGKRVWCYSCCYPEESWYLNKFIDRPARHARLLKWACFSQDITGFLHWGFNFWDTGLYGLQPGARFKGDGYIVYPDVARGTVQFSNRGLATLEGIEEYELLALAAETQPQAAKALSLRLARSFSDFDDTPAALEHARLQLFALCEAAQQPDGTSPQPAGEQPANTAAQ